MKKNILMGFFLLILSFSLVKSDSLDQPINNLNWAEVYTNQFAPQVILDFDQPVYFEKDIDANNMFLELAFPGMNIKDFHKSNLLTKLNDLSPNIIKKAELINKKLPCNRVVLKLAFSSKNFLVKLNKMEYPNRVILSIFLKSKLKDLEKNDSVVLYAANNIINSDVSNNNILKKKQIKNRTYRVLLDPGHGGQDLGAQGFFGLVEKNLTLDLSYRVKKLLKKTGFKVALTRENDTQLSLQERTGLASQLKADLMVSIHFNASYNQKASGIESYFTDKSSLNNELETYFFADNKDEKDKNYMEKADKYLADNSYRSKFLANCVQNGMIQSLQESNKNYIDRGVKSANFYVLLTSQIPVTLIEVGFLTNRKEAELFKNSKHLDIMAWGIFSGIKNYLQANNK